MPEVISANTLMKSLMETGFKAGDDNYYSERNRKGISFKYLPLKFWRLKTSLFAKSYSLEERKNNLALTTTGVILTSINWASEQSKSEPFVKSVTSTF